MLICPQVFKAGFFVGGEGGGCVLVGRSGAMPQASTTPQLIVPLTGGTWSGPAFYAMGGGSFGFQIGIQDSEMIFIVLTDKGLEALLRQPVQVRRRRLDRDRHDRRRRPAAAPPRRCAPTSSAIRGIARAVRRHLARGQLISARSDWNQSYYGQPLAAQQIVLNSRARTRAPSR